MAYATVQEFLARIPARFAAQLTVDGPGNTPDEAKIQQALDDATDEINGWLPRIAAAHRPSSKTMRVHCCKVALYLLTLGRSGKEFEQIRNAYTDVVKFYEALVSEASAANASPPIAGSAIAPAPVFTDASLKGFV